MTSSISCYPPSAKCHLLAGDKTINCAANYTLQLFAPEGHTCYQREMFLYPDNWERKKTGQQSQYVSLFPFWVLLPQNQCDRTPVIKVHNNNRFIFPSPNHSPRRALLAFCPVFCHRENLSPPVLNAHARSVATRRHARFLDARGDLQGFLPLSFGFCFWSDFWWEIYRLVDDGKFITSASSPSDPDLQYFICYLLSNRLAGGRASAGGAVCANDFKSNSRSTSAKIDHHLDCF